MKNSEASSLFLLRAPGNQALEVEVAHGLPIYHDLLLINTNILTGKIDLLVLNAGIGLRGSWEDTAYFQKILAVNLFGVINGISTLLSLVTSSASPSSIVITGSKQGITNPPGNPAYNASKSAVKTLAEHLSYDLSKSSPSTSVHLLVPGWTFTGLSGNSPFAEGKEKKVKPEGAWSPDQVVEYLEQKMGEGKFYVICPDNDVSEETDKKRVLWTANDLVQGRPPLTRWRPEYKTEAEEVSDTQTDTGWDVDFQPLPPVKNFPPISVDPALAHKS